MNMIKSEKQESVVEEKDEGVVAIEQAAKVPERKLRTLTVRSGVTAGLRSAGCTPCHVPNHNETLVTL